MYGFCFLLCVCGYFSAFVVSSLMQWFNYLRVSQLSWPAENCLFRMPWTDLEWNSNSPFVPRAFLTTKEVLVLLSPDTSPGLTSQSPLLPKAPSSTRSSPSLLPAALSHPHPPHTQWKRCQSARLSLPVITETGVRAMPYIPSSLQQSWPWLLRPWKCCGRSHNSILESCVRRGITSTAWWKELGRHLKDFRCCSLNSDSTQGDIHSREKSFEG